MREHQSIIASIRGFLRRSDQTLTEELRDLASEFSALGQAAESRIERCIEYLNNGLLGEAVHLAELKPPVLELAAALSFPERPQWDEVVDTYDLARSPHIDLARASALNQAYVDYGHIKDLLEQYRKLSLMRASTSERLAVLREIAQRDAGSAHWLEDIQKLEQPALEELEQLIQQAWLTSDEDRLAACLGQLRLGAWSNPRAAQLIAQLEQQQKSAAQEKAQRVLPRLERGLRKAMEEDKYTETNTLLKKLIEEVNTLELTQDPRWVGLVNEASQWLQDRYDLEQKRGEFEKEAQDLRSWLLSGKMDLDKFEKDYEKLERFGLAIPKDIAARYKKEQKKAEDEATEQERIFNNRANMFLMILAVPMVLVVLIGALIVLRGMLR